jgi:hypothetical protein
MAQLTEDQNITRELAAPVAAPSPPNGMKEG